MILNSKIEEIDNYKNPLCIRENTYVTVKYKY